MSLVDPKESSAHESRTSDRIITASSKGDGAVRRKIAKRYRKKILQSGAEIVDEHWEKDGDSRKDRCYVVEVNYCGWNIHAPEKDELAAYKAVLECFPYCEEEPLKGKIVASLDMQIAKYNAIDHEHDSNN